MGWPGENLLIAMWQSLVDRGIGAWAKPWQVRRVAEAVADGKAYEILALAKAEAERNESMRRLTHDSAAGEIEDIGSNNVAKFHEQREEGNLARAICFAAEILKEQKKATPATQIDDDWLFRWRDSASKTNKEEIQALWGRLLAGETEEPGSFSLRTLDFIRNVSTRDAVLITAAASLVIANQFIYKSKWTGPDKNFGLDYGDLLELQELGILTGVDGTGVKFSVAPSADSWCVLTARDKAVVFKGKATPTLAVYKITSLGREVLQLVPTKPNIQYLKYIVADLASAGYVAKLANWDSDRKSPTEFASPTAE